jgi:hypothetical protein
MIWLYTSKRFIGNDSLVKAENIISNPLEYFDNTILKDIESGNYSIESISAELQDISVVDYSDKNKKADNTYSDAVKMIIALKYNKDKKLSKVFNVDVLSDMDLARILHFADKYTSDILSVALREPIIYSCYTFILNSHYLAKNGNIVLWTIIENKYNNRPHIDCSELKELIFNNENNMFCFEFKNADNILLFEHGVAKIVFMDIIEEAIMSRHINCNNVLIITNENYKQCNRLLNSMENTKDIIRIINYDDYAENNIKLDTPNFEGLTIHALVFSRFKKNKYKNIVIGDDAATECVVSTEGEVSVYYLKR